MNNRPIVSLLLTLLVVEARAADAPPALKDPAEQKAWAAIAARFEQPPTVKARGAKSTEIAVAGLRSEEKKAGTASITVDAASGKVVGVTANVGRFSDDEFALFTPFTDLTALTLWHNGPATGAGLSHVTSLPKLSRVTLAGGGFADAGMAAAAKLPALREVRAWHCKFTDAGVAAFREHPTLESIAMGASWEPLLTDKSLEHLSTCPKLRAVQIAETRLTWDGGLRHLLARKETLKSVNLGNSIVDEADVERLRKELPSAKVEWEGLGAAGADFKKSWIRGRAEKWLPKELIEKAIAAAPVEAPSKK